MDNIKCRNSKTNRKENLKISFTGYIIRPHNINEGQNIFGTTICEKSILNIISANSLIFKVKKRNMVNNTHTHRITQRIM